MFFVYINLKERNEKNKHMNNMLKSLNLEFERFEGIRPVLNKENKVINLTNIEENLTNLENINNLSKKEEIAIKIDKLVPRIKRYLSKEKQVPRGLGIIGCYLSHLTVLKKYKNINSKYLCVLEDDVILDKKSIKKANDIIDILNNKNRDWDIIRSVWDFRTLDKSKLLCNKIYKFDSPNHQGSTAGKLERGEANEFCGGTHFQIINVKNIEKIINYLNKEYIYNIDAVYSTNEINVYAVKDKKLNISLHEEYKKHTNIPKV